MPFLTVSDAPPNIRKLAAFPGGTKVSLTLAQMNKVAEVADALEKEGQVDSPFAVAIAQFKKTHEVRNGSWVMKKRATKETSATHLPGVIKVRKGRKQKRKKEKSAANVSSVHLPGQIQIRKKKKKKRMLLYDLVTDTMMWLNN